MIRGCPQLLWKDQPALWSDFWLILELFLVENALMAVAGPEILQHLLYFPGMSPPVVLLLLPSSDGGHIPLLR